jgi:hypothetical protein
MMLSALQGLLLQSKQNIGTGKQERDNIICAPQSNEGMVYDDGIGWKCGADASSSAGFLKSV